MFIPLTEEPQDYVLLFDRGNAVQTVFWIIPMSPEQATAYKHRWTKESGDRNTNPERRAREAVGVDRRELQRILDHVDNAWVEGDSVVGEDVVAVIAKLDFLSMQELLLASQSMAALKEGAKKS